MLYWITTTPEVSRAIANNTLAINRFITMPPLGLSSNTCFCGTYKHVSSAAIAIIGIRRADHTVLGDHQAGGQQSNRQYYTRYQPFNDLSSIRIRHRTREQKTSLCRTIQKPIEILQQHWRQLSSLQGEPMHTLAISKSSARIAYDTAKRLFLFYQ